MDLYRFLRGVFGSSNLAKQDVPEVEAVITAIDPLARRFWERKVEASLDYLMETLQTYEERLGTDEVDALASISPGKARNSALERETAAIIATLEERMSAPFGAVGARAIESAGKDLLREGALALDVRLALPSPLEAATARRDLSLLLSGRVPAHAQELADPLRGYLLDRSLRDALRGSRVTDRTRAWVAAVRGPLGGSWEAWGPQTVDAWAYRWHNVGRFLGGEQAGVRRWVAINPKDERTTRFCNWVHGRTISARRTRKKLGAYFEAVSAGDRETMRSTWPLETPQGSSARFRRIFGDLGLPPYHFRCRTVAQPA